jgi:hypothetical protein
MKKKKSQETTPLQKTSQTSASKKVTEKVAIVINKSVMERARDINNVLILHKTQEELNEYRRIFYSVFIVFALLFLLGTFGLYGVQQNYKQNIITLEQSYQEKIAELEYSYNQQLEQESYNIAITQLDLESDSSLSKYVDPEVSFEDLGYTPDDLVPVGGKFVKDSKGTIKISKIAKQQLDLLAEQFHNETQQQLVIVS